MAAIADSPAAELRRAASLMRERARAVPQGDWQGRPWAVEHCAGNACPCIVYQGEYKPCDEPQVPPVQYVADAESKEHAAFIASWHPGVALAVADWLDTEADAAGLVASDPVTARAVGLPDKRALAVARIYLNGGAR